MPATTAAGWKGAIRGMPGSGGHMAFPGFDAARRAVIDIGSNSVRLVVYDGPPRAPIPICNEKALCGLGRDMTPERRLNDAAVREALATLARFRHVLDDLGDPPVHVIATAAVREASNGDDFVEAVRALGFDVDVVSGAEEGELSAFGVLAAEPDARGLVGDMGGGSLELAVLDGGVGERISLPIGPLSLMRLSGGDLAAALKLIDKQLREPAFLSPGAFETLYAVGGAWRSIARIHMVWKNYPLSVLHHYELGAADAIEVCDLVSRQSRKSLEEIPGITKRRIDTLPFAAAALKALLLRMKAKKVVVSAGGLREGLIYRQLSPAARAEDPFFAACRFYAARLSPDSRFGPAAYPVLEPYFASVDPVHARLRQGVCLLADIAAYFHPDMRARHAFDTALRSPVPGVSHEERVWAALALYHRHEGRSASPKDAALQLLSPEAQQAAVQYGIALRFVAALAPKAPKALAGCSLEADGDGVIFRAPSDRSALMGETPRRRLDSLASALGRSVYVVYEA